MILCVRPQISTVRSWYVRLVGEEVCETSLSGDQRVVRPLGGQAFLNRFVLSKTLTY